jgi:hypothetical protein
MDLAPEYATGSLSVPSIPSLRLTAREPTPPDPLYQLNSCLASIRFPVRRSLFFPDASAGRYSVAAGAGRPFLACSTR